MAHIPANDTPAQTGPGIPDEARGPNEDPNFELELERAEKRLRHDREHPIFGVHPDGVGPTLGQDLGQPNPGHDTEWNDETYDPPT
ncbi:MAG: hypothetical protein WDN45_17215 [Caulobacteraceae bacterium]